MRQKPFEDLLRGYLNDNLSKEELANFLLLVGKGEHKDDMKLSIERLLQDRSMEGLSDPSKADTLFANIMDSAYERRPVAGHKVHTMANGRRLFTFGRAAAAIILLTLAAVVYFFFYRNRGEEVIAKTPKGNNYKNDVLPSEEKAVLTLSDGTTILLEDAANGALTEQGTARILKGNGKLTYSASSARPDEILYNTIATPRGKQYQLELADGSRIWLNAGSSVRYPTSFTQKERRVEMTGEVYFEVARNKDQPFIVQVNNSEIRVLGTHFNVMAYADEAALKTTLLEGSVQFVNGHSTRLLKPGQQSQLIGNGEVKVVGDIEVEDAVAWKKGYFNFEGADIKSVMRQLSRWYDIEVEYDKNSNERFYAEIPCNMKLSDVLKALELTGEIKFGIDGKKVTVLK